MEYLNVLLIEDDPNDAELILRELERVNGHQINMERVDTEEGLKNSLQKQVVWSMIICDYHITAGFDALRVVELLEGYEIDTPVVMLSGKISQEQVAKVMIHKIMYEYVSKDKLSDLKNAFRRSLRSTKSYDDMIFTMSRMIDLKDHETFGHSKRVTDMTIALARRMGFTEPEIVHLRRGAMMHDIGKMGVPDSVLLKPGPLTDEEMHQMRRHPIIAYDFLKDNEYFRYSLNIPYCHHERWDGTGYPRGLAGENIPMKARIFAVVDNYDALTSDRPYRTAWSVEKALAYIREQSGLMFDPAVVDAFMEMMPL